MESVRTHDVAHKQGLSESSRKFIGEDCVENKRLIESTDPGGGFNLYDQSGNVYENKRSLKTHPAGTHDVIENKADIYLQPTMLMKTKMIDAASAVGKCNIYYCCTSI